MHNRHFRLGRFLGTLTLLLGLAGLTGSPALQAANCKGLSNSKCELNDACTWVASYKTKTGKTVEAYCRAKPKKGDRTDKSDSGKTAPDSKAADKKKKSEKKSDKKKSDKKSEKKKSGKKKSDKKKSEKKSSKTKTSGSDKKEKGEKDKH